tara:strand:- start:1122 stop:1610 length:489 start_codon:yes stop_codon:yes gene_type:complete
MTKSEKKAYKKARKDQRKEDIAKYGRGKKKRAARKAKDVAITAAKKKLMQASTRGVKDPDTMDMPIVDRERDAMNKDGGSMYGKKHGSSMMDKKKGASMARGKKDGMSMYGKKHGSSMSGEKYDAKMAYNKNLSPKARLHYLENERHDKTHAHPILKHMRKM